MNNDGDDAGSSTDTGSVLASSGGRFAHGTKIRQIMEEAKQRIQDELHERVAARSAKIQRDKYRADREAEGRNVRSYQWHAHESQQSWETREEYEARTHRDRQRFYRGTHGQFFGERANLSAMSEEERKQHLRELATERQRACRQRKREAKTGDRALNADDVVRLDQALQDLLLD